VISHNPNHAYKLTEPDGSWATEKSLATFTTNEPLLCYADSVIGTQAFEKSFGHQVSKMYADFSKSTSSNENCL
jgi:hypothetical protein